MSRVRQWKDETLRLLSLLALLAAPACGARTGLLVDEGGGGKGPNSHAGARGGSTQGAGANGHGGTGARTPIEFDKVDLLFVVDNSMSMHDKQQILMETFPSFVERLANPRCVTPETGMSQSPPAGLGAACEPGFTREMPPVEDMHIGVISSSLGTFGAGMCDAGSPYDDRAHLIPKVRPGVDSYQGKGFVVWDPVQVTHSPPGESNLGALYQSTAAMVAAVGEEGCGYEAVLEAWYRFLVDPEPVSWQKDSTNGVVDQELLAQRRAFLRPDSLVVIVLLSDENDCSLDPQAGGYLAAVQDLPRGTSPCEEDPNDPCCRPCVATGDPVPIWCIPTSRDPACQSELPREDDNVNVRCWQQKRRFGVDYQYSTERYVKALTEDTVTTYRGEVVTNPLLASRDPRLVLLTGIIGVPWQDLATAETLHDPQRLALQAPAQLRTQGGWRLILGEPSESPAILPLDPLMHESAEPRSGIHPVTGDPLASPEAGYLENPINGHEYDSFGGELQHACIFHLREPRDCFSVEFCNCGNLEVKDPVCQAADSSYSNLQRFAGANPGLRQLQVLRGLGDAALVGSICPKSIDPASAAFGYDATFTNVIQRVLDMLAGR